MKIDYQELEAIGGLDFIQRRRYINHVGLLCLSVRAGLVEMDTELVGSDDEARRYVFKARVAGDRGQYTGHGDADPSNVGPKIANATLRMAETRAQNRAMRSYCGIGASTAEELPECQAEGILDGDPPAEALPRLTVEGWDEAINRIENSPREIDGLFVAYGKGLPSSWTDEERAPRLSWLLSADGRGVLETYRKRNQTKRNP